MSPAWKSLVSDTNCLLEQAARHRWEDPLTGRRVALGVLKQFAETAGVLEARGWSAERIKQNLGPSRQVFATSCFMQSANNGRAATPAISKPSSTWFLASTRVCQARSGGKLRD
jgi:hypothetical protein